jgi:signal transduction histidine kinase
VDDLLDVSRIARRQVELKEEIVEIAEIVAKAIEIASPLLEQRTHTVNVQVERTGLTVKGDPTRLNQVVSNLLTNAAKYTPPGGHITI